MILRKVILVIILSVIPLRGHCDFSRDWLALVPFLPDLLLDILSNLQLLLVIRENSRSILCTSVGALPVQSCRIVHLEEEFYQLSVAELFWIKQYQKRLCVARSPTADSTVRWCLGFTTSIANPAVEKSFAIAEVVAI